MINSYIQNIFYHFILSDPTLATKIEPHFFDAKPLQTCFKCAKDYLVKYRQAPSATQIKDLLVESNLSNEVTPDIVDILYSASSTVNDYTYDWLYDNVTTWAQWKNFLNSIKDTVAYVKLNQDNVSVENVKEIMEHAKGAFNKSCILEFADIDDKGSDFWDMESHKQKKLIRSSAGYPFIDYCLNGGYFSGSLTCFVGAPKIGKSLWMQNLCAESIKKGENCCYISLELPEEMVVSRIGSNMFSIPSLDYAKYVDDDAKFKEKILGFKKSCLIPPGTLIVKEFPTSAASVIDLESYLLSKEDELSTEGSPFKFKNIFVDYINIMKNYRNPNTENTYMKIKQIAEDIKAMGIRNKWSIITATQTNREQYGKNDIEANMVSESSALGATVDIMFGIIATPMMMAQGAYYLKCIFDRVSPQANKKKLFKCDFNYLRITEDVSEGIIDVDVQSAQRTFTNKPNQTSTPEFSNNINSNQSGFSLNVPQEYSSGPLLENTNNTNNTNNTMNISPLIPITGQGMF